MRAPKKALFVALMLLVAFLQSPLAIVPHAQCAEGDYIDFWFTKVPQNDNPYGITTDGTNIWITDNSDDAVYKYDMDGGYIGVWSTTALNTDPRSITTDGTNIWIADYNLAVVFKYNMAGGHVGSWATKAPENANPHSIATDGTNIWILDIADKGVYKYDMDGGYIGIWSLTNPGDSPRGITTDGTSIWVGDLTNSRNYKYDMDGGYIGVWDNKAPENANPLDITTNGTNIWVLDSADDAIYIYEGTPAPGLGMEQVLYGGVLNTLHATTTEYNTLAGGRTWSTAPTDAHQLISTDGKIKQFRVLLADVNGNPLSPGAGKHYSFTLMVNDAPTALTFDISDAETSGSNMFNEITVTGGDYVHIRCDPDGTPTVAYASWTSVFESDDPNESLILGVSYDLLNNVDIEYGQVMCSYNVYSGTENTYRQIVPTSGTIKNFYVKLHIDPGTSPDAYRFTIRKGGASQSLTVTIVADDKTGFDLVNSLDVVAGDILTMMVEPLETPLSTPKASWGMTFEADVSGESIILGGSTNTPDVVATEYNAITNYHGYVWTGTESHRYMLGQNNTLKKFYILLSGSPGAGNKYDFTIRINKALSNVITTISDAETTGNSGVLTDVINDDEYISLQCNPDSSPNAVSVYWGFVSYIEPPPLGEFIENEGIIASDSTVDDEQWFFLNASIEVSLNASIFIFNRIDIDPTGLNMSCSYTNSTGFLEENDPNNYLQLDVAVSVKTDLNNTFVRVDYYLRLHSNVTKDGVYNVTVYSSASGGLNDTDVYLSVFTLTIRTPSAPTLLYGAGFNASSPYVELHWTHNLLIFTIFEVQNSSNDADWGYLGQNATVAQYIDSQVVNGTERYYKVRACRDTGVGWKNSSFTDSNFETVYFILDVEVVEDVTIFMGAAGVFWIIGIILVPIVAYMVKRR